MPPEHEQFLKSIRSLAAEFEGISLGERKDRFNLSFWTYEQIQSSLQLRSEWSVPENLIPFYGDWHDLMCLDTALGQVVLLNDTRQILFSWPSTSEFLRSLVQSVAQVSDSAQRGPRLVSMALSKELQQKMRAAIWRRKN